MVDEENGGNVPNGEEELDEEEGSLETMEAGGRSDELLGRDDPLSEEAFDLEHGTPLPGFGEDEGKELPWRSRVNNAKEFLGAEILYRYDILEPEEKKSLKGSYRLELRGHNGGVWTIEFGNEVTVVNRREEAEAVLSMDESDFIRLVNGDINPQLALLARKIEISGDFKRGLLFQSFISPTTE